MDSEIGTEQIPEGFAVGPGGCILSLSLTTGGKKKNFLSASQGPKGNGGGQDQARNHIMKRSEFDRPL